MHISTPSAEPAHATRQTLLPFYVAWIALMRDWIQQMTRLQTASVPKNDVAVQDPDAMIDRKASLRADPTDSAARLTKCNAASTLVLITLLAETAPVLGHHRAQ
jgi:hypothetical protein